MSRLRLEVPKDLRDALAGDELARQRFHALADSHQREYLNWVDDAKREETRRRRIEKTVAMVRDTEPPKLSGGAATRV